jgi:hypothetical protein
METYVNCSILADFFSNRPQPTPLGDVDDNLRWDSFWKFLKSETDLFIDNPKELDSNNKLFLSALTTGRGEAKIAPKMDLLDSPYKNILKAKSVHSFYCIDVPNQLEQRKFNSKNGYLIGFVHNYFEKWSKLKLLRSKSILPVRNEIKGPVFSEWKMLEEYLTPFTDAVLVDNYILSDDTLIPSNFEQIVTQLDKATPVKYNLLIVTFEGDKIKLNGQTLFDKIKELKRKNNWKCDFGLILTTRAVKEHDRVIFTNYLRIKSNDSFNYFNSKNEIITKGTDISFGSMADPDEAHSARAALNSINSTVNYLNSKFKVTHVFGNTSNRLL